MSRDEAFRLALSNYSWWYRKRMVRNISNGLGVTMLENVCRTASEIYRWADYYTKEQN